ncbi:MAG: flagellar biosynthetic protein FliR [Acetobacter sp.]|nr:flagellar biosynthetic protein FliR [Acetobacter sp.]
MNEDLLTLTDHLPEKAFIFLAILCRVSGCVLPLPGLGNSSSPQIVRAGLVVALSILLFPSCSSFFASLPENTLGNPSAMLVTLAGEVLCGLTLGWICRLICFSLPVAMQIIATMVGLASVIQPDPELGAQSTALSRLGMLCIGVLMFAPALYALPLSALVGSYTHFPPGHIFPTNNAAEAILRMTSENFLLACQMASPFILIGTLWPAFLGLLNRFAPAMQVYSLGMPAQMLSGIFLLSLFIRSILSRWNEAVSAALSALPGL